MDFEFLSLRIWVLFFVFEISFLVFNGLEFRVWNLILWFLACDLKFGILGLEYCSLGVRVWESVLGFVVWCLGYRVLGFRYCILSLEFGTLNFGV